MSDHLDMVCRNCDERRGEHHWQGMCPIYARFPSGETDYNTLIGFGGGEFAS